MRRARLWGFGIVLGVAVAGGVCAPRVALAQDQQQAAESFREGAKAFEKGDFRTAAGAFERAYKAAPHGSPMYNAGLAWESAHEPARAADDYQVALATPGLDTKQKNDAENRLASLEKSLGRIEVSGPPGTKISTAHVSNAALPAKFHLTAGQHDMIVIRPDGREETQTIGVAAGAVVPITVQPPPPAHPAGAVPGTEDDLATRDKADKDKDKEKDEKKVSAPMPTQRVIGIVAVGGAVVLAGAAIVLGESALNARDRFDASNHTDQSAHDEAASKRTWTNVCWVGAVALGAVGVYLIVTAKPSAATPPPATAFARPEVGLGVGPGEARLRVRF